MTRRNKVGRSRSYPSIVALRQDDTTVKICYLSVCEYVQYEVGSRWRMQSRAEYRRRPFIIMFKSLLVQSTNEHSALLIHDEQRDT